MGVYATTTSLDTLMPEVEFNSGTEDIATICITWAENEVNKKLSKRYDTSAWSTLTLTPPMITSITETLSLGYLHDQLSRGSVESQSRAQRLLDRAMANLEELLDYSVDLVDSSGAVVSDRSSKIIIKANTDSYSNTFNEDDPLNWKINSTKLSDIDSERS